MKACMVFLLFFFVSIQGTHAVAPQEGLKKVRIQILTKTGAHCFSVDVAQTPLELQRGLMGRRSFKSTKGMLFVFPRLLKTRFWMKDTYIPLDILFINEKGRVVHIHENARPFSREHIESGVPVKAALEILAGTVKTLGIQVGDQVNHSIFKRKVEACS